MGLYTKKYKLLANLHHTQNSDNFLKKEKKKQFITIFCVILAISIWRLIAFAIYNHNAEFKEQMAKAGRS